ncbi:PREDICTED: uncharacterized protein LOC105364516 [Ceratosolen solmsi marchali]|uniref:Uncharacterized protein LOC105364516 n=1 Tax=Ceratosolen solmsi marchali TaxID=326594 RepID=A0AAJ6YME5_9HYME|nr:PREDICTED: uncharacterized protein LOC105364516 [Ceratosolen solmsi marchali]
MHKYFKNKEISQFKHNEQFIMEQLELLTKLDEWTIKAHTEIIENLMTLQDFRYIALFIIEFIVYKMSDDETFDKTHTPPAPIMTRSEQKLITLILEIDKKVQNFSDMIIKGIQFRLFRLGVSQEVQIVERLFRILVVLNKIKKDREKVRIFCCDALYCLKLGAVNIIYVALMCWPEVLPKYDPNNDVIVKTIVHIIMSLKVTKPFPKLYSLKTLLFKYYNYPDSGYTPSLIKDELLKNLKENTPGVNTAMLLLCKSMGPSWAIENIIKELKQIIVTQSHPSLYEVLTLLGNILRPIRIETTYSEIYNIINQLCDVLDSNAGPDDLQEGVVSCLISISKFKYKQVARSVLKWQFNKSIRPSTNDKLKSFFLCQDTKWWWQFVQSNFPRPQQD